MISDPSIFRNSIHPDDEEKFRSCIKEAFETGKSHCEFRVIHKDGSNKTLKTQSTLKKGIGIRPDTLSGIAVDITELRTTENALIEKVDEVETILGSISDAFCTVDENWNFTYVNKAFCDIFNINSDTVRNTSLWDCFPKLKSSFFYTGMVTAKEDKKHVHMEGLSLSTGKMLSASFYPFKNGLAIYTIDITNETVQRQTIEEQQQQLIDIARFQSHQVRGPVATILGLAQLINTNDASSPMNKEMIEGLIEAAHELDRTIKQIDRKTKPKNVIAA
jgi:PAS domain S-box-containing protein